MRAIGAGPPLYLINAAAGTSDLFCLLAWLLRDEYRCVVFDEADTFDETIAGPRRRWSRVTAESLARRLFAVADSQGDRTFSVYGASFGSVVALAAMNDSPHRIERAILAGGFAHRRLSRTERLLCRVGRHLPWTIRGIPFWEALQRASHLRGFPPFDPGRWSFYVHNAGSTPIRALAARASIVATFDLRSRLGEIGQSVLLVRGEHEGIVAAGCRSQLERGLPRSTTETVTAAGHLAHLTHPHRLAACIRAFLARQEPLAPS